MTKIKVLFFFFSMHQLLTFTEIVKGGLENFLTEYNTNIHIRMSVKLTNERTFQVKSFDKVF